MPASRVSATARSKSRLVWRVEPVDAELGLRGEAFDAWQGFHGDASGNGPTGDTVRLFCFRPLLERRGTRLAARSGHFQALQITLPHLLLVQPVIVDGGT